jgi:peptidyl-prolyl cis-trans isomerase C
VRLATLTCAVALSLFLASCPEQKRPPPAAVDDSWVAIVNGQSISRQEFGRELAQEIDSVDGMARARLAGSEAIKRIVLEGMVERVILLGAAREANISPSTEEVERELLRLRAGYSADRFNEVLAQGQMSLADLKNKTAARLTIEKLFQEQVYPRVAVTEDEIRNYYEQHSADFEQAEQVRAAQIVVKTAQEARNIQQQLRAGKSFDELARKYSLSPDARSGGDLGFFSRGQMPRQFEEVAFRLKVNQVSDVVSTEYGFHLFKLLAKSQARKRPLSEVKRQIEQKLNGEKREQGQEEYVKMLRSKAVVKVSESTLAGAGTGPSSQSDQR